MENLATTTARPTSKRGKRKQIQLERSGNGKPLSTIKNFLTIMEEDPQYEGVRFNELTGQAEIHSITEDGKPQKRNWQDSDDAASREYIETNYQIHNRSKHDDALRILFARRTYNPLRDLVESFVWDGQNRCERFLTRWMGAEESPYSREISRLLFAGAINRLYIPGCKFDEVPVLVGTKQGEGKSTCIQWLGLHDDFVSTTRNLSGDQKSIEAIQGAWLVEIPEMAAFKISESESIKAFITAQNDKIRLPYDKRTTVLPRRCVFVGTSNTSSFLIDKTGNRRWYPIDVHSSGYSLYQHEAEMRDYICQCWAEARDRFKAGKMPPVANQELRPLYQAAQANAMTEDYRVGVITEYLRRLPSDALVCVKELWDKALFPDTVQKPTRRDQTDIADILDHVDGWERAGRPILPTYGQQRAWRRSKGTAGDEEGELPF